MKDHKLLRNISSWGGYLVLIGVLAFVLAGTFTNRWSDNLSVESNQDSVSYQETQIITTRVLHPSPEASLTSHPTLTASPTTTPSPTSKLTATPRPTITPTSTQTPLPPIAWDTPPPCDILQKDAADWHQFVVASSDDPIADGQLTAYLRQVQAMSFVLDDLSRGDLLMIFNTPNNAAGIEVAQRELMTLWLNVVSGQLNRATEVDFSGLPEIGTVGELLTYLEENLAKGQVSKVLLEASQMLLKNEGISLRVCDTLLYLQAGNTIQETRRTDKKVDMRLTPFTPEPDERGLGWDMYRMIPSPDYRWVAIQTVAYESHGPIYLWNRQLGELTNLNEQLSSISSLENKSMFSYGGLDGWDVIGWHLDSQHLLLTSTGQQNVFWVDLKNNTYQNIALPPKTQAGKIHIDLTPDGSKFAYVVKVNDELQINLYNLNNTEVEPLFLQSGNEGRIYNPRFSPDGNSIAYIVERGHPNTGLIYTLELFDSNTQKHTTLFEGNLGGTEPSWSPDGRMIAFYQKDSDSPPIYIPLLGSAKQRNLWVVSLSENTTQQITFIKGAAYYPIWSPDSNNLAFLTHKGIIGMTSLSNPGRIWQIATSSENGVWLSSMYFPMYFQP